MQFLSGLALDPLFVYNFPFINFYGNWDTQFVITVIVIDKITLQACFILAPNFFNLEMLCLSTCAMEDLMLAASNAPDAACCWLAIN